MIYHIKCGTSVYTDITAIARIITSFGFGKTVLRVAVGDIQMRDLTSIDTKFYCTRCNQEDIPQT